jgi:anti-sigma factor RsiW
MPHLKLLLPTLGKPTLGLPALGRPSVSQPSIVQPRLLFARLLNPRTSHTGLPQRAAQGASTRPARWAAQEASGRAFRRGSLGLANPGLVRPVAPFGGGFALAACLALAILLPRSGGLPDAVVSDHIRALQPGHLMDVVSTDQHTVKPWFDGRLNFAPPVKDLKNKGFSLAGGRLDYLSGRTVAALIYQRRQHVINLYVWPDDGYLDHGLTQGSRSGYNYVRWSLNGMAFWAVSDLAADELTDFARLLQTD